MPLLVGAAAQEMWPAANMSFALCPMLTQGAVEAIVRHGTDALKRLYLPKLISGEWTGTMCLTEPQAGSDLAALRSRTVPEGDHYRITGQKIFITCGDHDLAPNIIHLVFARLPDAPEGVKGISLFVVPKVFPDSAGEPGARNDLRCVSLEHKLGIHGSPTAVLAGTVPGGHGIIAATLRAQDDAAARIEAARFYATNILPQAEALLRAIIEGSPTVAKLDDTAF